MFGRLFGAKPQPPPPNSVVIPDDLVATLTADGTALDAAVDASLRDYMAAKAKAAEAKEPDQIPFWLRRDSEASRDIEDDLRDRVAHRRSGEDSGD